MKKRNQTYITVGACSSLLLLGACGGARSSGAGLLEIAGELSAITSSSIMNDSAEHSASLQSVEGYSIRCVTLSGSPQSGSGTADSTGAFTLNIDNSENAPIGCFILEDTSILASLAFENAETGMDGSNSKEGTFTPSAGTTKLDFNTVSLDVDSGVAVVQKANIVAENGGEADASGSWQDISGNWTIKAVADAPEGYIKPCPAGTPENQCEGPVDGMTVHLSQYAALDDTNETRDGMSIWQSSAAKTGCFGSGGGEGVDLPAGWSAASGSSQLTNPLNNIAYQFPDPANVSNDHNICGSSAPTCDAVTNVGSWASHGSSTTYSNAQCAFMCVVANSWDYFRQDASCGARYDVDWHSFNEELASVTPSWNAGSSSWDGITDGSLDSDDNEEATYVKGSIRFNKDPDARFMLGEIKVKGNRATLFSSERWDFEVCTGSNNDCSGNQRATCKFADNQKLTIIQEDSTNATFELVTEIKAAPGNHANCANYESASSSKWFFRAEKQ